MVAILDKSDFRRYRVKLDPDDFANFNANSDPPPSDLIKEDNWKSITNLTDDVSIITSDYRGSFIDISWESWGFWNGFLSEYEELNPGFKDTAQSWVSVDIADDFNGSIYNALVGFYRISFTALRSAVEYSAIGLYLSKESQSLFDDWKNGDAQLGFGLASDNLVSRNAVHEVLFKQYNPTIGQIGGLARRLYERLCQYAHSVPGFTDAGMRQSNGPIFVDEAFVIWYNLYVQVYFFSLICLILGEPNMKNHINSNVDVIEKLYDKSDKSETQEFYDLLKSL